MSEGQGGDNAYLTNSPTHLNISQPSTLSTYLQRGRQQQRRQQRQQRRH